MILDLAFKKKVSSDKGAAFGGVNEARIIVPEGFKAADAAEGGELDEEVGVQVEELADEVVMAVGGGPINGGSVPPLITSALPAQREVRLGHWEINR